MNEEQNQVKQRQLYFNNNEFPERHRLWGRKLYMFDIDCMEVDSNLNPVALIETKHGKVKEVDFNNIQMKSIRKLADKSNLPFFVVVYYFPGLNLANNKTDEFGNKRKYYVIPGNEIAKLYLPNNEPKLMSEKKYVELLYIIRKEPMPSNLELDMKIDFIPELPTIIYPENR